MDTIDYVTISTLGDATDFGNLTQAKGVGGGVASSTRVLAFGGGHPPTYRDSIEYVQIMSTGDAIDFGDLNSAGEWSSACIKWSRWILITKPKIQQSNAYL